MSASSNVPELPAWILLVSSIPVCTIPQHVFFDLRGRIDLMGVWVYGWGVNRKRGLRFHGWTLFSFVNGSNLVLGGLIL